MLYDLRFSGTHWSQLRGHLFPGDGLEAVALALCGLRREAGRTVLSVRRILKIPHAACRREPDLLRWPVELGLPLFEEAMREGCAVVKIHSHPGGFDRFSRQDDRSDAELFESLSGWTEGHVPHGSAVLLPDGRMFGRVIAEDGTFAAMRRIAVAGGDIHFFDSASGGRATESDLRNVQAFGPGTVETLKSLRIGVVGCSGTGSWVVEMLARLGVGGLVLVDPDTVHLRNLNRIVNSTRADVDAKRPKVEVMDRAVRSLGFTTEVQALQSDLRSAAVIHALAGCDVLFGCMDSADGRDLLNRISTFYCLPYFDVGVRLNADGVGGVEYIGGACHYLQPGGSSLLSRMVITADAVAADSLHRNSPDEYHRLRKDGYVRGVQLDSPAVCSVNGLFASLAVNDFLARLHRFRYDDNASADAIVLNLTGSYVESHSFPEPCALLLRRVGFGDREPLLDAPGL